VAVEIRDGVIASLSDAAPAGVARIELHGRTIMPGFIDSHVHLAYAFGPEGVGPGRALLAERGVIAGVDLAAPLAAMGGFDRERWLTSGPMITAPRGYPTRSWGADGFGLEVTGVPAVRDAVDRLADAGAGVIKVPLERGPALRDEDLRALVEHAHARGLKVAAHALGEAQATLAADVGIDVLAHTPSSRSRRPPSSACAGAR
jgi:imidazolonepropionase-like amidohydrolase